MKSLSFLKTIRIIYPGNLYISYWVLVIITQGVLAANTYYLGRLGGSFIEQNNILDNFWKFFITLLLMYPPGLAVLYVNQKMVYASYHKYIDFFIEKLYKKIEYKDDISFRKKTYPLLTSESNQSIERLYSCHFTVSSFSLNVLFNLIVLSALINKNMLFAYLFGSILGLFVIKFFNKYIKNSAASYQKEKIQVQDIIQTSWDTITIGNKNNFSAWKNHFENKFHQRLLASLKMLLIRESCTSLSMCIVFIPIIGTLYYNLISVQHDPALLGVFIATLPRQVQIVQYMQTIFSFQALFTQVKTHLTGIMEPLIDINKSTEEYHNRIQWKAIHWNTPELNNASNITDVLNYIQIQKKPFRIQISGPNGSGKSTILKLIKKELSDTSYYLPAHHELYFQPAVHGSTGEKCIQAIHAIISTEENSHILLLDEWNANLSEQKTLEINQLLDQALLKGFNIIEVCHHNSRSSEE